MVWSTGCFGGICTEKQGDRNRRLLFQEYMVGFLSLKKTSPKAMEVYVMGILPQLHRMGIGTRLMRMAEQEVEKSGKCSICR